MDGDGKRHVSKDYPRFNALVYSIDVFVPLVDLHQQKYWLPNASRGDELPIFKVFKLPTSGWWLRSYLWVQIAVGWLLTTLLALGLSGLIRR